MIFLNILPWDCNSRQEGRKETKEQTRFRRMREKRQQRFILL